MRKLKYSYVPDKKNIFSNEIRAMMYSFGDVKEPSRKSVDTMYRILREEMNVLLVEAEAAAHYRKSKVISHEDVLFLMRKNKGKLKRLIEYLRVMDDMHKFGIPTSLNFGKTGMETGPSTSKRKRAEKCIEFLAYIEDIDEFTSIFEDESVIDPAYKNMLERRNEMTKWMDLKEYTEFTENILRTSFCAKEEFHHFEKWLLEDKVINLKLTNLAFEICRFLAREVISKVVDMALILKSKKKKKSKRSKIKLKPFNFSKVAAECNISELLPSPTRADKQFDHLYYLPRNANESVAPATQNQQNNPVTVTSPSLLPASKVKKTVEVKTKNQQNNPVNVTNDSILPIPNVKKSNEVDTKNQQNNPISVTNDAVLSDSNVEMTVEVDNSDTLSNFPETSMDTVDSEKPESISKTNEVDTKNQQNNPVSVTNDTVLSDPNVQMNVEVDDSDTLSNLPGTSMDIVDLEKPESISKVVTKENSDSDSSVYQSATSNSGRPIEEIDILSDSQNQYFLVEDDCDSDSNTNIDFMDCCSQLSDTDVSTSMLQMFAAKNGKTSNDDIIIENISDDDEQMSGVTDTTVDQSSTRHSSNDMSSNMSMLNLMQDTTQSDSRFSSSDKSENILKKYYQEPLENGWHSKTPITSEEIIQAVALYHQHSLSNFFYSREKRPKIKLLCIDEYTAFKF